MIERLKSQREVIACVFLFSIIFGTLSDLVFLRKMEEEKIQKRVQIAQRMRSSRSKGSQTSSF